MDEFIKYVNSFRSQSFAGMTDLQNVSTCTNKVAALAW